MELNNLNPLSGRIATWEVGEAPSDVAGRDWLLNKELRNTYGDQYDDSGLGSSWSRWAGPDSGGGGGDFAGIAPYSGSAGRSGGSGGSFGGAPAGRGSAGYNVAQSFTPSREPSQGLAEFMKGVAGRGEPTFGDLPKLEFDEFEMPEIDESKVAMLTEQAGAADRGDVRNKVLRRIMAEARHIQNPTQRRNFIREALAGYGSSLAKIQQAAGREGRADYMNLYYNPKVTERQTNFQAGINAKTANFNADLNRLMAQYNFEGSRALQGDQMLYKYYNNYDV